MHIRAGYAGVLTTSLDVHEREHSALGERSPAFSIGGLHSPSVGETMSQYITGNQQGMYIAKHVESQVHYNNKRGHESLY